MPSGERQGQTWKATGAPSTSLATRRVPSTPGKLQARCAPKTFTRGPINADGHFAPRTVRTSLATGWAPLGRRNHFFYLLIFQLFRVIYFLHVILLPGLGKALSAKSRTPETLAKRPPRPPAPQRPTKQIGEVSSCFGAGVDLGACHRTTPHIQPPQANVIE